MLEASTSEDGASEEGIAAVLPGDITSQAGNAAPQDGDTAPEVAARAMLSPPDRSIGKCVATNVCISLKSNYILGRLFLLLPTSKADVVTYHALRHTAELFCIHRHTKKHVLADQLEVLRDERL